jgi:hypothetical protein
MGQCSDDVGKFCAEIRQGRGHLIECLRQHESELSASCRIQLERMQSRGRRRRAGLRSACDGDIRKHCATVKRGEGRVRTCLQQHEADLSPGCREFLSRTLAPTP